MERKDSGSQKKAFLYVFHSEGNAAREVGSENRFRSIRGRSAPAVHSRTGGMPSGPVLWNGSVHFITVW